MNDVILTGPQRVVQRRGAYAVPVRGEHQVRRAAHTGGKARIVFPAFVSNQ